MKYIISYVLSAIFILGIAIFNFYINPTFVEFNSNFITGIMLLIIVNIICLYAAKYVSRGLESVEALKNLTIPIGMNLLLLFFLSISISNDTIIYYDEIITRNFYEEYNLEIEQEGLRIIEDKYKEIQESSESSARRYELVKTYYQYSNRVKNEKFKKAFSYNISQLKEESKLD